MSIILLSKFAKSMIRKETEWLPVWISQEEALFAHILVTFSQGLFQNPMIIIFSSPMVHVLLKISEFALIKIGQLEIIWTIQKKEISRQGEYWEEKELLLWWLQKEI